MMDFLAENWKEATAFGVVLYCFIKQQNFLNKDLRGDLREMTEQLKKNGDNIQKDSENTEKLNKTIGNHLVHAIGDMTNEVKRLGDKIDKKFPEK
ncbi:MAG: hypothetical protein RBT65_18010 [Methanolobus sp.]|jgi:septal ring factor EnvC (AmiA/AmiB activator)|nr:hypothetical protein [Methanolobus sp.]